MTGISPAARGQPLVYLIQPVRPPERLAIDDDVGRAERTERNALVDLGLGAVLRRLVADGGAKPVCVQAELRAHRDNLGAGGDVAVRAGKGAVAALSQCLGPRR